MFKCPDCTDKYKEIDDLYEHIEEEHNSLISDDFTVAQYYYYKKTGKLHGKCVICKKQTDWNHATNKYHRFCKNPKCKDIYREEFKKRMIGKCTLPYLPIILFLNSSLYMSLHLGFLQNL